MARLTNALPPVALFALALAIRALPFRDVVRPDRIYLHGNDAYYHMRRIVYALANLPERLDFDAYVYFPHGARAIWPPFFDVSIARIVRPLVDPGSEASIEAATIWIPPLLGAAGVSALYFVARRHYGAGIATLASLVLCLLPAHSWYSQLGAIDHHVAVAFMTVWLFGGTLALIDGRRGAGRGPALASFGLGLGFALTLHVWPGALLHVVISQACLLFFLASRPNADEASQAARVFAGVNACALLGLLAIGAPTPWQQWGAYSPVVLTRFQPWLLFSATLFGLVCAGLVRLDRISQSPGLRALSVLAVGMSILGMSLLVLPGLREGAADAWQWLARKEAFQAGVRESQPLLWNRGQFDVSIAELRLSRFFHLLPLAALGLLLEARNPGRRIPALCLLAWALPLAAVTLAQRRFFNSFSIFVALLFAWSLVRCYDWLARRLGDSRSARIGAACGLGLAALILLMPIERAYRRHVEDVTSALFAPAEPRPLPPHSWSPLLETAEWLRDNTPTTAGYLDAGPTPEYGVMAAVGIGHVIQYKGRRPAVVDNFGDDVGPQNLPLAIRYFASHDEEAASRILEDLDVRYVVAEPSVPRGEAMLQRLFNRDGSGLERHRMIYESPRVARSNVPTALKIFQLVPGALLRGTAPAGRKVEARLEYRTNRERGAVYTASAQADARGRWQMRLPHSNDPIPSSITPQPHYRLESGGQTRFIAIRERDVLEGLEIEAPGFSLRVDEANTQSSAGASTATP